MSRNSGDKYKFKPKLKINLIKFVAYKILPDTMIFVPIAFANCNSASRALKNFP